MKLKTKHYVIIGALLVACLCLLVNTCRVGSKVDYHKGRADQALEDLQQAEEVFEAAIEQDVILQEEKDKRIAELEVEIAKDDQKIAVVGKEIVLTRETLIASGLYKGLVKELDEKWAEKYATLESKLAKKEEQLKAWQEKFDSKVEVAIQAYIDKDLKKQEALERFQKLCKVQEAQIKVLKLKGAVWKWAAIAGGGYIGYTAAKRIL